MEQITLGDIAVAVTFIVGLMTGFGYLRNHLKQWINQSMNDRFDEIGHNINELRQKVDQVDMETCKNYLVSFLSDVEQDEPIDEIERERFWEQYEHYVKCGGNSYIQRKVENLKQAGKL